MTITHNDPGFTETSPPDRTRRTVRTPTNNEELDRAIAEGVLVRILAEDEGFEALPLNGREGQNIFAVKEADSSLVRLYADQRVDYRYDKERGVVLSKYFTTDFRGKNSSEYQTIKERLQKAGGWN